MFPSLAPPFCTSLLSVRMLLAPTFFRDSQSSYGLWAGMANPGTVHAIPLLAWIQQPGVTTTPNLGPDWVWSAAPVLYLDVAQKLNLTLEDHEGLIAWLEAN